MGLWYPREGKGGGVDAEGRDREESSGREDAAGEQQVLGMRV